MSFWMRRALKRATLARVSPPAEPKLRQASTRPRARATTSTRMYGYRSAAGVGAAAGAATGAAAGAATGAAGRSGDGESGGSGVDRAGWATEQGEDSGGEDDGEEDEEEDEEEAEVRRKRKRKGTAKSTPAKRQKTGSEDYLPSSTGSTTTSSSTRSHVSLLGLGPILPLGAPPVPHQPGRFFESPAPCPRGPNSDEAAPAHRRRRSHSTVPSPPSSASTDPLSFRARPAATEDPASDSSDDPLLMRGTVRMHREDPLDRDFGASLAGHSGGGGWVGPSGAGGQSVRGRVHLDHDQNGSEEEREVADDEVDDEEEARMLAYYLRRAAEIEEAQRRRRNRGEGTSKGLEGKGSRPRK
ncbi:hypothetical protein Rt10032_c03g1671 [Rhodotorula toruloides]|uniref:Uncharacterized protein n=1 Tax=Rhodotorula toruloides TaxID=5286 RepID=A0A511KE06_RHOTO|nr:hypothetical protein Rt10032_c03g1671 [Rhodotorula toruloides]